MVDIKSTSSAAWWIKQPKKCQHRTTLCQDMTDLFCNISMHGYNKIVEAELLLYERLLWFCLHVVNSAIVIAVLSHTWENFVSQYFAIYLHDPVYPVEHIPFPGVSICSNNRISRQAAIKYARELSLQDPYNRSAEVFFHDITYFNGLYYEFERVHDFDRYGAFQSFLDIHGTSEDEKYFNIRKTLKMLSPKCSDFIVKCFINGKTMDCFGKDGFEKGFTMYGPCCIFNARNRYSKRNSTLGLKNADLGLTVVLNSSHSDDVASLLNMDAYIVLIHRPDDFPNIGSGNAIEVFPANNMESFIGITASFMDTDKQLRRFESSFRKCYFDDEFPDPEMSIFQTYSFLNCVVNCRVRSISALCGCLPFFVPAELLKNIGAPYCNLHHVSCLQRYNFKWRNVLTQRTSIAGLEREVEEGLYCDQCLPSCDDTQYDISMTSLPIDHLVLTDIVRNGLLLKVEEMSVLRVYFAKATALYYKRVVNNNWQEAFATVGNIAAIFLGFSMVAIHEMLFFVIKYLYIAFKDFISSSKHDNNLLNKGLKVKKQKLYILP